LEWGYRAYDENNGWGPGENREYEKFAGLFSKPLSDIALRGAVRVKKP
jgi:hypothetical protein